MLREKYNPDIFEKDNHIEDEKIREVSNIPTVVIELKWYEKLLKK